MASSTSNEPSIPPPQSAAPEQFGIVTMNQLQVSAAAAAAGQQIRLVKGEDGAPPQVITLSHLQNFLPIAGSQEANATAVSSTITNAQTPVKTYVSTSAANGSPQVVSVGLPQQFLTQVKIQLKYQIKTTPNFKKSHDVVMIKMRRIIKILKFQ